MEKHSRKNFGSFVRRKRLAQGMTQKQLAFESNLTEHVISQIETGKQRITGTTLCKLCEGLDMDLLECFEIYIKMVNQEWKKQDAQRKDD